MSEPRGQARLATDGELSLVAQLHVDFNAEFDDPAPPAEWLAERYRELIAGGDTEVLVIGTPAVGFAALRYRPSLYADELEAYLAELYIVPAERGVGLGRALLEAVLARARERGAGYIDLNTSETDTAAIRLYESLGFSRTEGKPGGALCFYYEREL